MEAVMIAAGHNNFNGLQTLYDIDHCLFQLYWDWVQQEWHDYESREQNGLRYFKRIGLPWTKFIFPRLTTAEFLFFKDTLAAGEESAPVTLYVWNMTDDTYNYYNGSLHLAESQPTSYDLGARKDVEIEFRDLLLLVLV